MGFMSATFRAGVGMVVLDPAGRVLILERDDHPGSWQFPQGGIEADEDPPIAMWRELAEEVGLTPHEVELVAELPEWLGYELPEELRSAKTGRGQVHRWFVLRSLSGEPRVDLGGPDRAEFRAHRWIAMSEAVEAVVSFRQPVYRHLAEVLTTIGR
jgi:putative (di)nucleoside polyphosphate hydrolase